MFIDGRRTDDTLETRYDLIIVGAGPAGITLANELKDTGLRIALLESGGDDYDDLAQSMNAGTIEGNDDEFDLEFSRLRYLGGTSNHWGGQCVPLDPIDFERAPRGFSGWPFPREALLPFYERAHDYCDLGAFNYDAATLAPQRSDYRLFPERTDIETTVVRQSTPTRFGDKYRPALESAEDVHVWLWTTATRVSTSPGEVEWVETATPDGPARRFTARAVVLAGGTIEATRLLLWSNEVNGTAAGNAGQLLGRCYMDHPSGGAGFLSFSRPVGTMVYWSGIDTHADAGVPLHFVLRLTDETLRETGLPNAQFYVIPFAEDDEDRQLAWRARQSIDGMKTVAKWALGRDVRGMDIGQSYCDGVTGLDDLVRVQAARMTGAKGIDRVLLKYEVEQSPDLQNRIRLDASDRDIVGVPRPILNWTPETGQAVREIAGLIGRAAGAEGIGRFQLETHDDPYWGATTAWHQLGTLRMAESPTSGVTTPNARVHGAGALYVAGGGLFPSVGRSNPTLTVVALSVRLADHLKETFA